MTSKEHKTGDPRDCGCSLCDLSVKALNTAIGIRKGADSSEEAMTVAMLALVFSSAIREREGVDAIHLTMGTAIVKMMAMMESESLLLVCRYLVYTELANDTAAPTH